MMQTLKEYSLILIVVILFVWMIFFSGNGRYQLTMGEAPGAVIVTDTKKGEFTFFIMQREKQTTTSGEKIDAAYYVPYASGKYDKN